MSAPVPFVSFEGIDGVGKTTQLDLLARRLRAAGREVVVTREPGATALGAQLRRLLLDPAGAVSPRTEALLYAADRADHVDSVIRPALRRGAVVLSDRYLDSSLAYQGAGRQLGIDEVRRLSLWATGGLLPGLTVLLDADPDRVRARLGGDGGLDRLELERIDFHRRVRQEFLRLAAAEPERFLVLDALADPDALADRIAAAAIR